MIHFEGENVQGTSLEQNDKTEQLGNGTTKNHLKNNNKNKTRRLKKRQK